MALEQDSGSGSPRIALIGVGGTGCALLPLLCALPVERITLIDGDTVEAKNLDRQLLYATGDVDKPKVFCAVARQQPHASHIRLVPHHRFVDAGNCKELLSGHHVVADCSDDLAARALVEACCRELRIPLVSGAVHGHQVQVFTAYGPSSTGTVPHFFQGRPSEEQLGCDMRQVPAAITTLTAALMALRIEDLLKGGMGSAGVMDLVDGAHGRWMRIQGPEVGEFIDTPVNPEHRG